MLYIIYEKHFCLHFMAIGILQLIVPIIEKCT